MVIDGTKKKRIKLKEAFEEESGQYKHQIM
jgi:hypothetical protein